MQLMNIIKSRKRLSPLLTLTLIIAIINLILLEEVGFFRDWFSLNLLLMTVEVRTYLQIKNSTAEMINTVIVREGSVSIYRKLSKSRYYLAYIGT